eukprot:888788-Pyramimonas_sp.AAC.1
MAVDEGVDRLQYASASQASRYRPSQPPTAERRALALPLRPIGRGKKSSLPHGGAATYSNLFAAPSCPTLL